MNDYHVKTVQKKQGNKKMSLSGKKLPRETAKTARETPVQTFQEVPYTEPKNVIKQTILTNSNPNTNKKERNKVGSKSEPTCKHLNIVPLEIIFGKHKGAPTFNHEICDWSSSIMGAHRCRIYSYWCPTCNKIILAPKAKVERK